MNYLIKFLPGPRAVNPRYWEIKADSVRQAVTRFRRIYSDRPVILDVFGPPLAHEAWREDGR